MQAGLLQGQLQDSSCPACLRRQQQQPQQQQPRRAGPARSRQAACRAEFVDREAPPLGRPGPPPPPPPPGGGGPEPSVVNKRAVLVAAAVSAVGAAAYRVIAPMTLLGDLELEQGTGRRRAVTAGRNRAYVDSDVEGRAWLYDEAGHLFYDTGDPRTGVFIVDSKDDVYNSFLDDGGRVRRQLVGNLADLQEVHLDSVAGVPLPRDSEGRSPSVTLFRDRNPQPMAPNAPLYRNERGQLEGPPLLEEGRGDFKPR